MRLLTGKTVRISPQLMGGVELRAQVVSHALIRHSLTYSAPSSIRFTLSTLTVGSPKTPRESALGAPGDDLAHLAFALARGLGKARDLVLGGIRRDLRVEAGPRTRHQVDGHSVHIGIGVGGADLLHVRIHKLPILITRRGQIGRGTIRHEPAIFAFDN